MMFKDLPQLVPQKVCLSCQGCCRFKEVTSSWRPKIAPEEIKYHNRDSRVFGRDKLDQDRVRVVVCNGLIKCAFLNLDDNTCGIYGKRPFECRFYPFLLGRTGSGVAVYVHLSCPYIQENKDSPEFIDYIGKLKSYLETDQVRRFIRDNSFLAADYASYRDEVEEVFKLGAS